MIELKKIKINLKSFIESFFFAHIIKDVDKIDELKEVFENVFSSQKPNIKKDMLKYIMSNNTVIDNVKLLNYFTSFQK